MTRYILIIFFISGFLVFSFQSREVDYFTPVSGRWSEEKINQWYAEQPWLVGANYYPATAINQIEMWQELTWDPETIDKELGWAADIGMNTMRVFLHRLVWLNEKEGLYQRMDEFLDICQKYGIRPWFVFFDDCHYPIPKMGRQPVPVRAFHNSGWLHCPARGLALRYAEGKATAREAKSLKAYVQEIMTQFKDDERVLMWELYNEPGRSTVEIEYEFYSRKDMMGERSNKLVYDTWVWAREVNPSQPITSTAKGSNGKNNIKINRINADLHSIHSYGGVEEITKYIRDYQSDDRPVMMTEWLARKDGSTVQDCLPLMKEMKVGAVNWGFVNGKSQTAWDRNSRKDEQGRRVHPDVRRAAGDTIVIRPGENYPEPALWFHDLFRVDGTPFSEEEIAIFKKLTDVNH